MNDPPFLRLALERCDERVIILACSRGDLVVACTPEDISGHWPEILIELALHIAGPHL